MNKTREVFKLLVTGTVIFLLWVSAVLFAFLFILLLELAEKIMQPKMKNF